MKDDSGSYAVFIEQGSSASQMTAAKVMDIISRLPGCAGQAADAVTAYTQVKMEDAPTFLKIPKSDCPDICVRLPKHKWPKLWSSMEGPVVLLERNFYDLLLAGFLWERQLENVLVKYSGEKVPNWECLVVNRARGPFVSVHVDDIFLTTYVWDALKESVKSVMSLWQTTEICSNPGFSAGAKEELPITATGQPDAETISSWSCGMEGHAKKCVERHCELANKTTPQSYKVATPCMGDHQFRE